MSTLYLAATPIGNLEDITLRVMRILNEVPLIAAEDTRKTTTLLHNHQITTPLTAYHDHNKDKQTPLLLQHLVQNDLALVSDAGTPGVNDPGYNLVRAALEAGHQVVPLPGPSAPITALSVSGLPTDRFLYLGYLPRKSKARRDLFMQYRKFPHTMILLETPHRLIESLTDLLEIFDERDVVVAREMTKLHEEIFRGSISESLDHFKGGKIKGEITLVIAGSNPENSKWSRKQLLKEIEDSLLATPQPPSRLAKDLAEQSGWHRSEIYDLILEQSQTN